MDYAYRITDKRKEYGKNDIITLTAILSSQLIMEGFGNHIL